MRGSWAVFKASEVAMVPNPGRIMPPSKHPSALTTSMLVRMPRACTSCSSLAAAVPYSASGASMRSSSSR